MIKKAHLNQIFQDGATDGQVIVWDNSILQWIPGDNSDLNGIYGGSGIIPGPNVNAQLDVAGEFFLSFNGAGIGGLTLNDLGKSIKLSSDNADFQINITDTGLILSGDAGAFPQTISISPTTMLITDSKAVPRGIQYAADYSATYTARSLVDRGYVDAVVLAGGADGNGIYSGSGNVPNSTDATILGNFGFSYSGSEPALQFSNAIGSVSAFSKNGMSYMAVDNIQAGMGFDSYQFLVDTNKFWFNDGVAIGVQGVEASALLEIDSTTGALLISRMTTTQRDALTAVNGMLVYNVTSNAFNIRQNGAWVEISTGGADGNGIYSGSGNVPNLTAATVDGDFKFLYAGDGVAIHIDSVNGLTELQDNGGVAIINVTNDSTSVGYDTTSLFMDSAGTLFTNPVTLGNAGFETSGLLELDSTTGALLLSRMTTTQKNALTAVNGMIVYDNTLQAFAFYQNSAWVGIVTGATPPGGIGDILQNGNSFATTMTIGTNDNNTLALETFGVTRMTVSSGTGIGGIFTMTNVNAGTNVVQDVLIANANSSGTPVAGYGVGIQIGGKSATVDNRGMGRFHAEWLNVTDITRTSRVIISGVNNASYPAEYARFGPSAAGNAPLMTLGGGTTTYGNGGITTGGAYIIGNSANIVTVGNSTGAVDINSQAVSSTAVRIQSSANSMASSVTMGGVLLTLTSGAKQEFIFGSSYTPASGTGTWKTIVVNGRMAQTGGANGIIRLISLEPAFLGGDAVADLRCLDISADLANVWGIYQNGTITKNYFNGPTLFGTTTQATGAKITLVGNQQTTGQYHALAFTLTDAATIALDWNNGNVQTVTLGGNRTFTFANPREGGRYLIKVTQDGTGNRTLTWPTVLWSGGSAPVLTATANRTDIISLVYIGGNFYGTAVLNFF